ncbi:MAG: ATP synthase F0 subunit C [Bdellovibrionales bacterium]|nr:ATP synthase F0 subunit C [Bdellovibrionales bacterium]
MVKQHYTSIALGAFVAFFAVSAFGADADVIRPDLVGNIKTWLAVAAGFGMALATIGGAIGQSKAIAAALDGIARNPGAQNKIFIPMIVGLALIESLVLFTFLVTSGLAGKI